MTEISGSERVGTAQASTSAAVVVEVPSDPESVINVTKTTTSSVAPGSVRSYTQPNVPSAMIATSEVIMQIVKYFEICHFPLILSFISVVAACKTMPFSHNL